MGKKQPSDDILIGKFEIPPIYAYTRALLPRQRRSSCRSDNPVRQAGGVGQDCPTYFLAGVILDGLGEDEAKQRGMVAAIMGARTRLGIRGKHESDFQAQKQAAEKKKKTTITAESFDHQVANKMGDFFDDVFLPTMKKLVEAGFRTMGSRRP